MEEIWRVVLLEEGFDMYEVSSFGRVRLERPSGKQRKKILTQSNSHGYKVVALNNLDRKRRVFKVHRLVAFAFCEGYEEGLVVNHIDEDKTNNHFSNLEWTTQAENLSHNGNRSRVSQKLVNGKGSSSVVGTNIKTGEQIYFPSTMEAQRAGFTSTHVAACARGARKTHKGYRWEYKEE